MLLLLLILPNWHGFCERWLAIITAFVAYLCILEVQQMFKSLRHLLRDKKGATAVEYGIMVAAIAAVIIATVFAIGVQVEGAFDSVLQCLLSNGIGCGPAAPVAP